MPWDVDNLNPGVRFFTDEEVTDPLKREWVELRIAANDDLMRFRKECMKKGRDIQLNPKTRKMEAVEILEVDDDKFNNAINTFCIVDWHLVKPDGNLIPCTDENKLLMMGRSPKFATWIAKCLESLREIEEEKETEERKN